MTFTQADIAGAYVIELDRHGDDRGFFARLFCEDEFAAHGLTARMVQINTSYSAEAGTLRGLHYQTAPHEEAKLMRCVRGSIYDVVADLRPDSPTYRQWTGVRLTADNRRMMYVPQGCAHGFLTLEGDTEVIYPVSAFYAPGAERGVRYDDPALGIDWPIEVRVVSDKDRGWPALNAAHSRVLPHQER
jgi:dTDP-4-dehydrorhamnose 3,5-epimerase